MHDMVDLPGDVFSFDLKECGLPGITAGFFVRGKEGWMLLETGPASSAGTVLEASRMLGIKPNQLKYIAVTHIHLDHAGGLGAVAGLFPEAALVLHPYGARHMIDPSRLNAGALKLWGREKMERYGDAVPVARERVKLVAEGDVIDLGDRRIMVWETPGHSKYHVCFFDTKTRGLFAGDAAGVYYPALSRHLQRPVLRPATPPPDFDGESMIRSLARIAASGLVNIYFTHFGAACQPRSLIEAVTGQVCIFMELGKHIYSTGMINGGKTGGTEDLALQMKRYYTETAAGGIATAGPDSKARQEWENLIRSISLSANGILLYLEKVAAGGPNTAVLKKL